MVLIVIRAQVTKQTSVFQAAGFTALAALAVLSGCSSVGNSQATAIGASHGSTWVAPPPARCEAPAGEVLEYWREAQDERLLAMKTLGAAGDTQTFYYGDACEKLSAPEVEVRIASAAKARRAMNVNAIGDDRVVVQIWLGSSREYGEPISSTAIDAERGKREQLLPALLRRSLAPIPGSFALVGNVSRAEALAIAAEEAVRVFFVYAQFAKPAPADVAKALALPEVAANRVGTIAVFDDCAEGSLPMAAQASFAAAAGVECFSSLHGVRVSSLAFAGLPEGTQRVAAGLTMVTTDAPESLASPALWAMKRQNTDVLVQTIHIAVSDGANDALDMLLAEAAYGQTLLVRASGNGDPKDPVVHRILGSQDVGAVDERDVPLMSMRMAHPYSLFGDRKGVWLLDKGVTTDAEGSSEGTSFSAPRVAAAAMRMLANTPSSLHRPLALRARLSGWATDVGCTSVSMESPLAAEDSVCGAGIRQDPTVFGAGLALGANDNIAELLSDKRYAMVDVKAPATGQTFRMRAALVFDGDPSGALLDPMRSSADLDLRVIDSAGHTVANAQSFDNDQEVALWDAVAGQAFQVRVERLGANPVRHAVLAWSAAKN